MLFLGYLHRIEELVTLDVYVRSEWAIENEGNRGDEQRRSGLRGFPRSNNACNSYQMPV